MNTGTENLVLLMTLNTIGESILVQALQEAYIFVTSANMNKHNKQSYMFINGSGLDAVIETYHLGYNAQELRNTFYWKLNHANS